MSHSLALTTWGNVLTLPIVPFTKDIRREGEGIGNRGHGRTGEGVTRLEIFREHTQTVNVFDFVKITF